MNLEKVGISFRFYGAKRILEANPGLGRGVVGVAKMVIIVIAMAISPTYLPKFN